MRLKLRIDLDLYWWPRLPRYNLNFKDSRACKYTVLSTSEIKIDAILGLSLPAAKPTGLIEHFSGFFLGDTSFLRSHFGIKRPSTASKIAAGRYSGPPSPNLASVLTSGHRGRGLAASKIQTAPTASKIDTWG